MFRLFASCDPVYFDLHAPALICSAALAQNNLHLHVINAEQEHLELLDLYKKKFEFLSSGKAVFTFSWNRQFTFHQTPEQQRTIFACDRFVSVIEGMERRPDDDWLIIDTDCIIMNHIEQPDDDQVGLFLREPLPGTVGWENAGSRVAAGAVYYSHEALPFARNVMYRIKHGPYDWFLDQIALNEIYQKELSNYRFRYFDANFMDWEFKEGTTIWTGKGPRKYDNPTYVAMKNKFDKRIR